ncbi:MAG: type II toxin-antitoxin system death-on-curing family toxin [Bacillati bacterium ANGP1]|uniref:Type II toxin-antitoxin system death-on-curing family toxin n=1 Tax=Candidatus Segetimicrobium genomatis TaxID=2569760 RepID=A0A537JF75_9BACT|nr:MAG: type II toxin-antitoxin system death-on-curing family toxin [Terrabacteria group bacterium ANGP1]
MKYVTADQLKTVNHRMIRATGGLYLASEQNVVYPPSLDSLVNFVQTRIALRPQPSVWEIAAFYVDRLTRDQVFHDGNKRTALEAARLFLEGAGYRLSLAPANESVEFVTNVARGSQNRDTIADWLRAHAKKKVRKA